VTPPICWKIVLNISPTGAVRVWSGTMSNTRMPR
jgi:hypothetical protein